jgi:predicted O-methyltransferase YrrM
MKIIDAKTAQVLDRVEQEEKDLATKGERTNWIIEQEAISWICDLILEKEPKVIVECGTSVGYSTIWLATAAKQINAKVISVEKDPQKVRVAENNIQKAECAGSIELKQGDATEVMQNWQGPEIDFLFLDANKKGYLPQFLAAKAHMSKNAIVIADNVVDMADRLQEFTDYMLNQEGDFSSEILEIGDGLLVAKKN